MSDPFFLWILSGSFPALWNMSCKQSLHGEPELLKLNDAHTDHFCSCTALPMFESCLLMSERRGREVCLFPILCCFLLQFELKDESNQIYLYSQNYKSKFVSRGFDELYRCDIFCPQTFEPGEEKLKKKEKKETLYRENDKSPKESQRRILLPRTDRRAINVTCTKHKTERCGNQSSLLTMFEFL